MGTTTKKQKGNINDWIYKEFLPQMIKSVYIKINEKTRVPQEFEKPLKLIPKLPNDKNETDYHYNSDWKQKKIHTNLVSELNSASGSNFKRYDIFQDGRSIKDWGESKFDSNTANKIITNGLNEIVRLNSNKLDVCLDDSVSEILKGYGQTMTTFERTLYLEVQHELSKSDIVKESYAIWIENFPKKFMEFSNEWPALRIANLAASYDGWQPKEGVTDRFGREFRGKRIKWEDRTHCLTYATSEIHDKAINHARINAQKFVSNYVVKSVEDIGENICNKYIKQIIKKDKIISK